LKQKVTVNNTLIDAWFTVEQLNDIKTAVKYFYDHELYGSKKRDNLHAILEHLDHLIEHYE